MCALARTVCLVAIALAVVACSSGDDERPGGVIDGTNVYSDRDAARPAPEEEDGGGVCGVPAQRDCVIDRGVFMGIHDCAKGVQSCKDGRWGPCQEF